MTAKNFDTALLNLDNTPLINELTGETLTMKTPCVNALMAPGCDEDKPSGEEKAKRYALAMKLLPGGEVELTAEDIVLIKRLVGIYLPPLTVGRVFDFLEA